MAANQAASANALLSGSFSAFQVGAALLVNREQRRTARANERLGRAQADAANKVRASRNVALSAEADTSRFLQSINNQRQANNAGRAQAAALAALARTREAGAANRAERRLAAQESLGALAAQAAFSGVATGPADALAGTLELQTLRAEQRARAEEDERGYQLTERVADAAGRGIANQDIRAILPGLDRGENVAPQREFVESPLMAALGAADFKALAQGTAELTRRMQARMSPVIDADEAAGGLALDTRSRARRLFDLF